MRFYKSYKMYIEYTCMYLCMCVCMQKYRHIYIYAIPALGTAGARVATIV